MMAHNFNSFLNTGIYDANYKAIKDDFYPEL